MARATEILAALDRCCDDYAFPMLDNGYVYLAATRLTLFRGPEDWGLVIQVFGHSVRSRLPDTYLYVFGSNVQGRPGPHNYVSHEAWEAAMANSPNHWHRSVSPIDGDGWIDPDDSTLVGGGTLKLRGSELTIPRSPELYSAVGIQLESRRDVLVHEVCRWLAMRHRDQVLATEAELSTCFGSAVAPILSLESWHHPDVVDPSVRPSGNLAFQQLAQVLQTGDVTLYAPTHRPNTHWSNWPEGGLL